jgi:lysophospholipase L1-like esterase
MSSKESASAMAWGRLGSMVYRVIEQLFDPAQTERYQAANAALLAEGDARARVVFIGDSLIEGWRGLEALAPPRLRFVGRGVSGQTSGQILLRFEDDAMALSPVAVIILAGANDVRAFFGRPAAIGPAAQARIARHVTAMVDIAAGRGVRVAIGTLPPARPRLAGGRQTTGRRDLATILEVNAWLRGFAAARACPLIDFHAALLDDGGAIGAGLSADGLHPNAAGYGLMAAALAAKLEQLALEAAVIEQEAR